MVSRMYVSWVTMRARESRRGNLDIHSQGVGAVPSSLCVSVGLSSLPKQCKGAIFDSLSQRV